jgi:hypothetical protein
MAVINREALIKEYKANQSRKGHDDIGFTWVIKANQISLVNWTEMAEQVNQWKDLKKGGVREVRAYDYNNKEFVVEGKKWYVLIVQHYTNDEMEDEANIMCPVSLMLFGTMVSGMTYAFEEARVRDEFFDAINDKKDGLYCLRDTKTKKEFPRCGLCGKFCECFYGHNPFPIAFNNDDDRKVRVCDKCNAEVVIPARILANQTARAMREEDKEKIATATATELARILANQTARAMREEEEKEKIATATATELINADDIAPPKQEKVKTKAELKKEQTRNANKAKAEEKKLKEEQDRLSAIAYAKSQADKKKKAREVAIKKQKAWLKEGEKFLAELEKLNEEEA